MIINKTSTVAKEPSVKRTCMFLLTKPSERRGPAAAGYVSSLAPLLKRVHGVPEQRAVGGVRAGGGAQCSDSSFN